MFPFSTLIAHALESISDEDEVYTNPNFASEINMVTEAVTDLAGEVDMPDLRVQVQAVNEEHDPDDNPGDADASGDASAFVGDRFFDDDEDQATDTTLKFSEDHEVDEGFRISENHVIQKPEKEVKLTCDDYVCVFHFIPGWLPLI